MAFTPTGHVSYYTSLFSPAVIATFPVVWDVSVLTHGLAGLSGHYHVTAPPTQCVDILTSLCPSICLSVCLSHLALFPGCSIEARPICLYMSVHLFDP